MSNYSVGDFIIAPGRCLGTISSVHRKEVTIIWKDNELSAKYTFSQIKGFNYQHIPKDSQFKIGDRFEIVAHKKYSGEKGYLSGYHTDDSPEFWVKLDNYDLQIRVFPDEVKFLEDEKEAIAPCQDSHNLTSAQELEPVFALEDFAPDSNLSESQKLMNTVAISSQNGSPMSATMATCEVSQCEISENSGEKSTLLQLRHHASPFQSRESDKEKTTPATVSPPSNEQLNQSDQDSSVLKTCQDCSIAHFAPEGQHSIFSTSYARLPNSATMRNGFVSVQETLEAPLLEKDCFWLESPGALSNGKGRPPGQTKQEAQLKKSKVLAPGEVINPEFLESAYNLPLGWTDPQENRSALELLAEMELCAIAAPPLEMPLTGELPPLDFTVSLTSTPCAENQPLQLKAITLHEPWAYLVGRYKWFETRDWSTNYRGKIAIHAAKHQKDTDYWCSLLKDLLPPVEELVFGAVVAIADLTDCILMTEQFISQQSETELKCGLWEPGRYAWKLENIQILPEPIPARGKQGLWNIELPFALVQPAAGIAPQSLIDRFLEENRDYECTHQSEALVLCPSCELQHIYLSGGCGMCGLAPANFLEEKMLSANIERTQQLQIGVRVRITKTRTQNLSQWVGHIATVTGINGETISVAAGVRVASRREGREKKHLTLKKGWYEVIPENFLEETEPATTYTEKPKHRQRKGCLYKYLENKKLKNGTIASYPRVIGHRQPDNPTHWRWGFNWEIKDEDGEWKGRSIGSIPVGAIPLIQSMQNEGAPLEEIIAFIRRAKAKK